MGSVLQQVASVLVVIISVTLLTQIFFSFLQLSIFLLLSISGCMSTRAQAYCAATMVTYTKLGINLQPS